MIIAAKMSVTPLSGPVIILHKHSLPPSSNETDWPAEKVRAAFSQLAVNTRWTLNSTCPVSEDTGRSLAHSLVAPTTAAVLVAVK